MTSDYDYCLSPRVRARKEGFGLLFYNSKDTNLTFVKSGDLLNIKPVSENKFILIADCDNSVGKEKLAGLIKVLLEKGLVIET